MQQEDNRSTFWLTEEEFERFTPKSNHILVESVADMDEITFKSLTLYIDTTYNPENHQEVINKVIKTPENKINKCDLYESHIDVEEGDIVWCQYLEVLKGHIINVGDRSYRLVPFYSVYLSIDFQGEHKMHNGYLLCDKIYNESKSETLTIVERKPPWYAKVLLAGKPVISYKAEPNIEPQLEIKLGDILLPWSPAMKPFERPPHFNYDGEEHFVAQRNRFLGIIELEECESSTGETT